MALGPPPCPLPFPRAIFRLGAFVSFSFAGSFGAPELAFGRWRQSSIQAAELPYRHFPDSGLVCFHSGPSLQFWTANSFYCGRGQRETSVALGSPPVSSLFHTSFAECCALLRWGGQLAAAFFLTLAALHLLALWRLVLSAVPGGRSPLLNLLSFGCAIVPACVALPWDSVSSPSHADKVTRGHYYSSRRHVPRVPFWARLPFCFWALPIQVWAVPPELASALTEAHAALTPDPGEPSSVSGGVLGSNQGS